MARQPSSGAHLAAEIALGDLDPVRDLGYEIAFRLPDDLQLGHRTQEWLATSDDKRAKVSGRYFFHQKETRYNSEADDVQLQDRFLDLYEEITGVSFP